MRPRSLASVAESCVFGPTGILFKPASCPVNRPWSTDPLPALPLVHLPTVRLPTGWKQAVNSTSGKSAGPEKRNLRADEFFPRVGWQTWILIESPWGV